MTIRTATETAAQLRAGETSAIEVLESCLSAIDAHEPTIRAMISVADRDELDRVTLERDALELALNNLGPYLDSHFEAMDGRLLDAQADLEIRADPDLARCSIPRPPFPAACRMAKAAPPDVATTSIATTWPSP